MDAFQSPFSLSRNWELFLRRIPSNMKPWDGPCTQKEALKAIATIGAIGGAQLSRLFVSNKAKIKRLLYQGWIHKHEMKSGKQVIPVYTLGLTGCKMFGIEDHYWIGWEVPDILKRVLFFELYKRFREQNLTPKILPAPEPMTGTLDVRGKDYAVYVARDSVEELTLQLKWDGGLGRKRILVVAENLNYLKPLAPFLGRMSVRAVTDRDLLEERFENMFHRWDGSGWARDEALQKAR